MTPEGHHIVRVLFEKQGRLKPAPTTRKAGLKPAPTTAVETLSGFSPFELFAFRPFRVLAFQPFPRLRAFEP